MSRTFGPLRQNGYVVPDIEAALQHWTAVLGLGPGTVVEIFEISGAKGRFFEHIAKRAAAWDGSDPIRRMRPEPAAASEP